jgi:ATP-dependent DNA helicase RecG
MADNPIFTVEYGLLHFEYRTYPEIALREALMNAFCHTDYRISGPILVKQFTGKLEISNPGGFVGGISPANILHHQPVARKPHLVEVLTRLRLVNRSNLGIPRMFTSLLIEGKEPPLIEEHGEAVKVTFLASEMSIPFRTFVADEGKIGRLLSVDHLLILQHLLRHAEIDTATAAHLCQRGEAEARHIISQMERAYSYLDRGGTGRGTYWRLRSELYRQLSGPGQPERSWRTDWEAAKTRVLSVLRQQVERGEPGLTNGEIRQLTNLDRGQVQRLMMELRRENPQISAPGIGRGARYSFRLGDGH